MSLIIGTLDIREAKIGISCWVRQVGIVNFFFFFLRVKRTYQITTIKVNEKLRWIQGNSWRFISVVKLIVIIRDSRSLITRKRVIIFIILTENKRLHFLRKYDPAVFVERTKDTAHFRKLSSTRFIIFFLDVTCPSIFRSAHISISKNNQEFWKAPSNFYSLLFVRTIRARGRQSMKMRERETIL